MGTQRHGNSWSSPNGSPHGERYVHVRASEVVVGEHYGSGQTDNAGACSHAEFLAGRFQDIVRSHHGDRVLAEVIAAVKARSG